MQTRPLILLLTLLCLLAVYFSGIMKPVRQTVSMEPEKSVVLLSDPVKIDKLYQSMLGPAVSQRFIVDLNDPNELLWLTGLETELVNGDAVKSQEAKKISNDFFCHANLLIAGKKDESPLKDNNFREELGLDDFFFTLVPGRQSINLPEGFGIPFLAGEMLESYTMSLNQTVPEEQFDVRFRSYVKYQRSEKPLKPLFFRAAAVNLQYNKNESSPLAELAALHEDMDNDAASCAAGLDMQSTAINSASSDDALGQGTTSHWLVPPGEHQYVTDVTSMLNIPYDTTVHYVTGHLHPQGKNLELYDLTEEKTVFLINSKDHESGKIVNHMEEFSYPQGKKIFKDHKYQLIARYNNKTDADVDAMGMIYLYLLDNDPQRLSSLDTKS